MNASTQVKLVDRNARLVASLEAEIRTEVWLALKEGVDTSARIGELEDQLARAREDGAVLRNRLRAMEWEMESMSA